MEFKTLVLGLLMSFAAFAVKAGGGLAYVWLRKPGILPRLKITTAFMAGYALVFTAAGGILTRVDVVAHLNLVQGVFKSGMVLHFMLAALLAAWGGLLLKQRPAKNRATGPGDGSHLSSRGWLALVVPCPVCFFAILLSAGYAHALFPDRLWVFFGLFAGFILISLIVAWAFAGIVRDPGSAENMLGWLMLAVAAYFLLSVIVIPPFGDVDRIYRISLPVSGGSHGPALWPMLLLIPAALAAGFFNPFKKDL